MCVLLQPYISPLKLDLTPTPMQNEAIRSARGPAELFKTYSVNGKNPVRTLTDHLPRSGSYLVKALEPMKGVIPNKVNQLMSWPFPVLTSQPVNGIWPYRNYPAHQ